jgi:hypothetical protein
VAVDDDLAEILLIGCFRGRRPKAYEIAHSVISLPTCGRCAAPTTKMNVLATARFGVPHCCPHCCPATVCACRAIGMSAQSLATLEDTGVAVAVRARAGAYIGGRNVATNSTTHKAARRRGLWARR